MQYIVYELATTCWKKRGWYRSREVIEIGAVRVDSAKLKIVDKFSTFVRPLHEPELSEFCRNRTTIRQEDIDKAPGFASAFTAFREWIGKGEVTICSWGDYRNLLRAECQQNSIRLPALFNNYLNIHNRLSERLGGRRYSLVLAMRKLGMSLSGNHKRGIDKAHIIARVLIRLLREEAEAEGDTKKAKPGKEAREKRPAIRPKRSVRKASPS